MIQRVLFGLTKGQKAFLWPAVAAFWYVAWILMDMVVMTILKSISPDLLGLWALMSVFLGGIVIFAAAGMIYYNQKWRMMLAATCLIGGAMAAFTWSMLMVGLQAATDPAMLELLRLTPLFK